MYYITLISSFPWCIPATLLFPVLPISPARGTVSQWPFLGPPIKPSSLALPPLTKCHQGDWTFITSQWIPTGFIITQLLWSNKITEKIKTKLKSMVDNKEFLKWLLIGWQLCCQPIRSHIWKFLLTRKDFWHGVVLVTQPPGTWFNKRDNKSSLMNFIK